jgi:DNA-binding NarL/FixJ family response regulator
MISMKQIRIVIADDHEFFRNGLQLVLVQHPNYEVISHASNGQELIDQVAALKPELAIVDISMPIIDGIEATRIISALYPETKVIALSMHNDDPVVISMMHAGALSYILKNTNKAEIFEVINAIVAQGRIYFPLSSAKTMVNLFDEGNYKPLEQLNAIFSAREVEIIGFVCKEFTIKEIANMLRLSPRTVESHRARIMRKMKVKSMAGMVAYAFKHKLLA